MRPSPKKILVTRLKLLHRQMVRVEHRSELKRGNYLLAFSQDGSVRCAVFACPACGTVYGIQGEHIFKLDPFTVLEMMKCRNCEFTIQIVNGHFV